MIHRLARFKDSHAEAIWLTIYGDLITNLVLLFLALYGLTVMGGDALSQAMRSMQGRSVEIGNLHATDQMDNETAKLAQSFKFDRDVTVSRETRGIRIQFGEHVLFGSGQALLKSTAMPLIEKLAEDLKSFPYTVIVEGHTDSVPLTSGSRYRDNWELSLARSMSVVSILTADGVTPAQVAAAAYGDHRPIGSNLTANGRRLNRRVEVVLTQDFPFKRPTETHP